MVKNHNINEKIVKRLKEELKKDPYGLSIKDFNDRTNFARDTIIKYLMYMQGKGIVEYRAIGNSKVFRLVK